MALFDSSDSRFARAVSRLVYSNPFLPERVNLEQEALGDQYVEGLPLYQLIPGSDSNWPGLEEARQPNLVRLDERVEQLADAALSRLRKRRKTGEVETQLYRDLVYYLLYRRYRSDFDGVIQQATDPCGQPTRIGFWARFLNDFEHYLNVPGQASLATDKPEHAFACFFQIRRAFFRVFHDIVGSSRPTTVLRGEVWQSIFTHKMRRYAQSFYGRMNRFPTLICGASGTGKEMVARAVGLSSYIPFDPAGQSFVADFTTSFHPVNLTARSLSLIDSDLFGHCEGAYTDAKDRIGWLGHCTSTDTLFLDEIGELDLVIQAKLLRVLETRTFQRLGETENRDFSGKIVAATNRDLAVELQKGRFREDFFFRLCADMIHTPSLQEQLTDTPQDLRYLVDFITHREFGDAARPLTDEVLTWIERKLEKGYAWPGNIRELQQCIRNIAIRGEYRPINVSTPERHTESCQALAQSTLQGTLTADQLMQRYCTLVYARTGNFVKTAEQLKLDRRTVQRRIDPAYLETAKRFWRSTTRRELSN